MTQANTPEAQVGRVVGGTYQLLKLIGQGEMGAVYEALHKFTGKHVALKLMHARTRGPEEATARFLREAKAASAIGHPGIVNVLDAGREKEGALYIVMELLDGETLDSAMEGKRISTADVLDVGGVVLAALGAAHARGIVHRDIKPENIFVVRGDDARVGAKLVDFGVAKHLVVDSGPSWRTLDGFTVGTPFYMSPEQCCAEPVDGRSDLWSLGAVLFHALAGRVPFEDTSLPNLLKRIVHERAPSLGSFRPDLPPWVVRAVDRALEPDRTKRWQTAAEMEQELCQKSAPIAGLDWDD